MTTLHYLQSLTTGGPHEIPCPLNERIRIVAAIAFVAGVSAGDQAFIIYRRSQTPIAFAAFPSLQGAESTIAAGIGQTPVEPLLSAIDPVTGVAAFLNQAVQCAALPDITFDTDITVLFSTASGTTFSSSRITYERIAVVRSRARA